MDHVVYLDRKAKELENLASGIKTMIIRGAMGRKLPYGKVVENDTLYFIENIGDGLVKAKAEVTQVFNSEQLTKEQSLMLVEQHQSKLMLNSALMKRFAGKRYIVLITIKNFVNLDHFRIDRTQFGNMDDWLPVGDIKQFYTI